MSSIETLGGFVNVGSLIPLLYSVFSSEIESLLVDIVLFARLTKALSCKICTKLKFRKKNPKFYFRFCRLMQ